MKKLLTITAIIEASTGLGLLAAPAALARLLLGGTLDTPGALTVARVGGTALLAIAHNGNLGNGTMFPIIESFTGKRA